MQLDITFGDEVGFVPDVAGPFTYYGCELTRDRTQSTGSRVGQYGFIWQIPAAVPTGVYMANWTSVFGSDTAAWRRELRGPGGFVAAGPGW